MEADPEKTDDEVVVVKKPTKTLTVKCTVTIDFPDDGFIWRQ